MIFNGKNAARMIYQLINGKDAVVWRGDDIVILRWKYSGREAVGA